MELIERPDLNVVKYLFSIKYVDFRSDCIDNAYDKGEKRPTEKDMKTWYSILQQFCKTNLKMLLKNPRDSRSIWFSAEISFSNPIYNLLEWSLTASQSL